MQLASFPLHFQTAISSFFISFADLPAYLLNLFVWTVLEPSNLTMDLTGILIFDCILKMVANQFFPSVSLFS